MDSLLGQRSFSGYSNPKKHKSLKVSTSNLVVKNGRETSKNVRNWYMSPLTGSGQRLCSQRFLTVFKGRLMYNITVGADDQM